MAVPTPETNVVRPGSRGAHARRLSNGRVALPSTFSRPWGPIPYRLAGIMDDGPSARSGEEGALVPVRMCANRAVAGVRSSSLRLSIRSRDPQQFASAHQIIQLEGLAVAIPWGFESPLPHFTRSRSFNASGRLQALGHRASRPAFGHESPSAPYLIRASTHWRSPRSSACSARWTSRMRPHYGIAGTDPGGRAHSR